MNSDVVALATIVKLFQGWEVWGVLVALIIGPWIANLIGNYRMVQALNSHQELIAKALNEMQNQLYANRLADQREFDKVTRYYEDNVRLVEVYEKLAGSLADIIQRNTMAVTKLIDRIDNNHFCPMVRKKGEN
jgi:hypothetical protein